MAPLTHATARAALRPGPTCAGVAWAQTTRFGGGSTPPYGGFNLAPHVGEDPALTAVNWTALARHGGPSRADVATCHQVHGDRIVTVARGGHHREDADALVSVDPGLGVGVFTADCVPVLYAVPGTAVAAAHCGWRGAARGLAGETLTVLAKAARVAPSAVHVWLAPAIAQCSYEVGEELRERFDARHLRPRRDGKLELDVGGAVVADLLGRGAAPARVARSTVDTYATPACYSYRREGTPSGRMLSYVRLRPT